MRLSASLLSCAAMPGITEETMLQEGQRNGCEASAIHTLPQRQTYMYGFSCNVPSWPEADVLGESVSDAERTL